MFTGRLNSVPPKPTPAKVKGEDDNSDTDSDSSSSEVFKDVKESAESASGDGVAADKNVSTEHE